MFVAVGGDGSGAPARLASECPTVRRYVYSVGVTDGGVLSRMMSDLASITLGRDEFKSDLC